MNGFLYNNLHPRGFKEVGQKPYRIVVVSLDFGLEIVPRHEIRIEAARDVFLVRVGPTGFPAFRVPPLVFQFQMRRVHHEVLRRMIERIHPANFGVVLAIADCAQNKRPCYRKEQRSPPTSMPHKIRERIAAGVVVTLHTGALLNSASDAGHARTSSRLREGDSSGAGRRG